MFASFESFVNFAIIGQHPAVIGFPVAGQLSGGSLYDPATLHILCSFNAIIPSLLTISKYLLCDLAYALFRISPPLFDILSLCLPQGQSIGSLNFLLQNAAVYEKIDDKEIYALYLPFCFEYYYCFRILSFIIQVRCSN